MKNLIPVCCLICLMAACHRKQGPPFSPRDALETFRLPPGYRIEPFLNEPKLESPVAMDFDENGNLYVVEDRGYPLNINGKLGRVKMFRDTDGDGIPDKMTIFADHLVLPTGVMRWKKGILVTDAPNVWYMEDTDGDGKADVKKAVLAGFPFTNPQHTVNTPLYGLDNWIYLANEGAAHAVIYKKEFGDPGSPIHYVDRPGGPVGDVQRNIRFRPDSGQLETLSSISQFGQSFDDYGRHFLVSNSNHVRMEVIAERYVERNPDIPIRSSVEDISDHGAAAKVFPITSHPRFEMLSDVGVFTSACGICYYQGSTFTAEPVHNIVHQDQLSENGSLYLARRVQKDSEFLASTDPWFRPVYLTVGPDGALYVVDYYRMIIEHPEWMATDQQHSPDLYKGQNFGRIYRIIPPQEVLPLKPIRLGSASNRELVAYLANPVIWWRRNAQRLLLDRKAVEQAPEIEKLFRETSFAPGRVHALWTLDGLGKLTPDLVQKALSDPEPGVRENAMILAEKYMGHDAALQKALLAMENDPSPRVRYQLVQTLGFLKSPAVQAARDRMLFRDVEDRWFQIAALSADSGDAPRIFAKASSAPGSQTPGRTALYRTLSAIVAARQRQPEIEEVLARLAGKKNPENTWWRAASLEGLSEGLRMHHGAVSPRAKELTLALFESGEAQVRHAALQTLEAAGLPKSAAASAALARASATAKDAHADAGLRADSISLLALSQPESRKALFQSLIDPHQPDEVQAAAVRAFGRIPGEETGKFLIQNWRNFTSKVRSLAADALLTDPGRQKQLLAAIQDGSVQPWTLSFHHRIRLVMNMDPDIRNEARALLEQTPKDREAVVKRYQEALDRKGDPADGKRIFENICSKCHRLNGRGHDVGPDLGTIRNQPKQALLTDILIPSLSIAQGYESYVVETTSGGNFDGVIGQQTPTTITLKHEDGKEDVIRRQDIKAMYATNLSAMPGDLEKQISVREMAGLLEFLKNGQ